MRWIPHWCRHGSGENSTFGRSCCRFDHRGPASRGREPHEDAEILRFSEEDVTGSLGTFDLTLTGATLGGNDLDRSTDAWVSLIWV